MNIHFKTTEILYIISCVLFVANNATQAWIFFGLGILASLIRFSLEQSERLEKEKKTKELEEGIKNFVTAAQTGLVMPKKNTSSLH